MDKKKIKNAEKSNSEENNGLSAPILKAVLSGNTSTFY